MIGFLRNLVVRDFWLKLFSLALAILIWQIVSPAAYKQATRVTPLTRAVTERDWTLPVPLGVVSSAADVRDFKVSPSQVEVTVRGEPAVIEKTHASEISAFVDLTGIESARGLRKRIVVTTPAGVTFVRVNPEQVDVIVPPK